MIPEDYYHVIYLCSTTILTIFYWPRSDYKILHEHGGLYFDTDVEVIKPMDDITERGPLMGFEINPTGRLRITENTRSIHWFTKTWLQSSPMRMWCSRMFHRIFGVNAIGNIRKISGK